MDARSSLRRAGTLASAIVDRLRAPAPVRVAQLDLAPAAAALRRAGADVALVRIDARSEPWTTTGLTARQGAQVTWLAHGESWVATRRGPHFDAGWELRLRTGMRGPALEGTGATFTAAAPHDGPIELCSLYPGELRDNEERIVYDRTMPRALFRGGFDVAVGVWPAGTDVAAKLADAAIQDATGLCRTELARIRSPAIPPAGWESHRHIPYAGLHHQHDGEIDVRCQGEVEIIRHPVRVPLTEELELHWRWRLDKLPARRPEDTLFTHDYVAVAVEFDDGRDLTYHWSVGLPTEASYRCPFPHWRRREWHLVVRSGSRGLGTWQKEERRIARDRTKAIGGRVPRDVVAVWLIASCVAAGGEGICSYSDIDLVDRETRTSVL